MKTYLTTFLLSAIFVPSSFTQVQYTGDDYQNYSGWFKQYGQTSDYKNDGTTLLTFVKDAPVRTAPLSNAEVKGKLQVGQTVRNIAIIEDEVIYGTLSGYRERWLRIEACHADGKHYTGYVWAGHIAKNWQHFDLDGDGEKELIALGLSEQLRQQPEDIRAGLKIIRHGQVLATIDLPGICLFEACEATSLLRIFDFGTEHGTIVFESTIFSEGCLSGIDKALVAWNGQRMQLVHRAEYTTGHTYTSNPLYLHHPTQTQVCYYKSENRDYDPVWNCRTLEEGVVTP